MYTLYNQKSFCLYIEDIFVFNYFKLKFYIPNIERTN